MRAGNTSLVGSWTYLLDTARPDRPQVQGPTGPASQARPVVTLAGEGGGTWSCVLTGPAGSAAVACGPGELALLLDRDGSWTLAVTQTDAAGNTSLVGSWTYLLDTARPDRPQVQGPTGPAGDPRPMVTLTGEAGGSWTCVLTGPGGSVPVACGAGEVALLLDRDGSWTLAVTQTDAAGNTSLVGSWTYLLDTARPDRPQVQGPTGPANDPRLVLTLVGEAGGRWTCVLTGPGGSAVVACGAGGAGAGAGPRRVLDAGGDPDRCGRKHLAGRELDLPVGHRPPGPPAGAGPDRPGP
jgi:hypothetical protein